MQRLAIFTALLFTALTYPAHAQSPADHNGHYGRQDQVEGPAQTTCPGDQSGERDGMMEMMKHSMKERTKMGGHMAGSPIMFRMIFALMDADGDGAISLSEFQAAHERLFKAMDSNKDSKLTPEEIGAFMHSSMDGGSLR